MSRPTSMKVGGTVYWTLMTYDADGLLIDADSTPTVAVRKNGSSVADSVSVAKRSSTTGIYDCNHSPSGEVEGDCFGYEESVAINGDDYINSWNLEVDALMSVAPTVADIVDGVWDETTASHNTAGTFGYEINNSVAPPTVGEIADAVWDEPISAHTTINTFGNTVVILPSAAQIADGVWDESDFLHTNSNTFGKRLYDLSTADETADAVWDTIKFSHQTANTFGEILNNTGTPLTAPEVANAVWDETTASHTTGGSFGLYASLDRGVLADLDGTFQSDGSGGQQFTTVALENAPSGSGGGGGDATLANQTQLLADIAALNDFDPANDTVANVTLVATTSVNSDMRGTDGANTVTPNTVAPDNASIAAILVDTADLQANQGQWLTATGFSTFDSSVDTVTTDTASRDASKADVSGLSTFDPASDQVVASNMRGTDGANTVTPNTVAPDNASIAAILLDTADLQANQGSWLTANVSGLASQASVDVLDTNIDTLVANQGDWATADVSGLLTASGYTSSLPSGFSTLIIGTGVDAGKVTTSNPASGGGSAHTAQDVANLILAVPSVPIGNTATGSIALVDTTTDVTNQSGGGTNPADIYAYFTAGNNEDVFKADVSGLSTFDNTVDQVTASNMRGTDNAILAVSAPANWPMMIVDGTGKVTTSNPASGGGSAHTAADVRDLILAGDKTPITMASNKVSNVVLVDTTTNLTNGGGGGNCPTAQEIVDTWGNQPQGVYTTSGTFGFYLDAQVSTAGSGGAGLYQATVRVQDTSNNALQGARVNVDGTTLTLTTDSSGEVTFNLDSGVYLLEVSPPANYDTPLGQVLTVGTSDPSDKIFTLSQTTPPSGCTPPWIS